MKLICRLFLLFALVVCCDSTLLAQSGSQPNLNTTAAKPVKVADGAVFQFGGNFLKVEVWGDDVIRIACATNQSFFARSTPATEVRVKKKASFKLSAQGHIETLTTAKLKVQVDLLSGAVSFLDAKGNPIVAEKPGGREILPAEVQGEKTSHIEQQWTANDDESLYGLG